ncbi:uncharacterized protein LOC116411070 [Xenopus tropicalis]|uniref:Uncharacterized protein LOC116411070 n=1 Tax=Xenopus tropicalis TaxID=8364 RepID=A0A8J1JQ66_XENTR|nr:uncharacterized protein LOC116411070 [Xenopus tropicalis]
MFKTLHRNHLLPIGYLEGDQRASVSPNRHKRLRHHTRQRTAVQSTSSESELDPPVYVANVASDIESSNENNMWWPSLQDASPVLEALQPPNSCSSPPNLQSVIPLNPEAGPFQPELLSESYLNPSLVKDASPLIEVDEADDQGVNADVTFAREDVPELDASSQKECDTIQDTIQETLVQESGAELTQPCMPHDGDIVPTPRRSARVNKPVQKLTYDVLGTSTTVPLQVVSK